MIKPGIVRVNDVPQIQPTFRGLGPEWAGKVQHDGGVGTSPDTAGDSQQIRAGIIVRAGPDEHLLGFLPLLRMDAGGDIVHLLSALHLQDAVSVQFSAEDQIVLFVAMANHGVEFAIRILITPSKQHLAIPVQQLVLTAVKTDFPLLMVCSGTDGVSVRQDH